jgi:Flp pilus assembly protein TadD
VVVASYLRTFGAGFVSYDDDLHVYANPFLNPPSLENLGQLWRHGYGSLYVPLAYTILAGVAWLAQTPAQLVASIGRTVTVNPAPFHVASVGFHLVNAMLCFYLVLQLTRSRKAAGLSALVFAVHPLQVESVAWISELRGLSSGCFALAALNVLVLARRAVGRAPAKARVLWAASAVLVTSAMLCKPAAVVLPGVALLIDRLALGTSWRKSMVAALAFGVCLLPFALLTRSLQIIHPEGASLWWQRPFVAGDALAFYLLKAVVPIDLCVDYGRTPASVMSHGWSYVVWVVPASLLVLGYRLRRQRTMAWLGALLFVTCLLPVLGLVPFTYQVHSTVADRYAYLPMLGLGLVVADVVVTVRSQLASRAAAAIIVGLAVLAFNQSGYWVGNVEFLRHTLAVNPEVRFATIDLGNILLTQGRIDDAIEHFSRAVRLAPNNAEARNNLGLALLRQGRLAEAEPHFRAAVELNPRYFKAHENLGAVYLRTERLDAAIASLQTALSIRPSEASAWNDLGVAFMRGGRAGDGVEAFRRAVELEPRGAQYRKNLGHALMQSGQTDEARRHLEP